MVHRHGLVDTLRFEVVSFAFAIFIIHCGIHNSEPEASRLLLQG